MGFQNNVRVILHQESFILNFLNMPHWDILPTAKKNFVSTTNNEFTEKKLGQNCHKC